MQITTDGLQSYISAIEDAFGADVDYSQLIKLYGSESESEKRYSPCGVYRYHPEAGHRPSGPEAHQHVLRGAPEPHDAE